MTEIDARADIEVRSAHEHVVARVPLAGPVAADWARCYQRLARATDVPVRAETGPDRTWLVVAVAAGSNAAEVAATMNAVRNLVAETDAATDSLQAAEGTEASVRGWWQRQQRAAAPAAGTVRTGIGAERRWVLAGALAVAIAVLVLLPSRFSLGPSWLVPAIEAILLAVIFAVGRLRSARRSAVVRWLSAVLVFVLVAGAAFVAGRLVIDLVEGGPETNSAADLLRVGAGVWLYTIIAFAFLYWLLDGRGPEARILDPPEFPDLAFPQQLNPVVARPGWRPEFSDYLYLGFTNATAFSPTDVMPLARWGKLAMTIQAVASLAILGLVIARAVNIFR